MMVALRASSHMLIDTAEAHDRQGDVAVHSSSDNDSKGKEKTYEVSLVISSLAPA
jgi:hypothetical protein